MSNAYERVSHWDSKSRMFAREIQERYPNAKSTMEIVKRDANKSEYVFYVLTETTIEIVKGEFPIHPATFFNVTIDSIPLNRVFVIKEGYSTRQYTPGNGLHLESIPPTIVIGFGTGFEIVFNQSTLSTDEERKDLQDFISELKSLL